MAEKARDLVRQPPPAEIGRATWTLAHLARQLAAEFEHPHKVSHEAVRRLLAWVGVSYRRAKKWLTSPDPRYELKKQQRDRLLRLARQSADGVAVWVDESWFVRWPYQFHNWVEHGELLCVPQRWNEKVDTTALFAALEDESQQALLHWAEKQPNSDETVSFLEALTAHYAAEGKRFIMLLWDKAPWHMSNQTRNWLRAYKRKAKQSGLPRLIVGYHPTRSPWLMPLEPIFGWVKHQVLGGRTFETVGELQEAVELAFELRVPQAKARHDKSLETLDYAVA